MANLAIRGHATRGKEVIEILEMLGGRIEGKMLGTEDFCSYYIDSDGSIDYKHYSRFDDAIQFTLEEFLEKFPYKVGDRVKIPNCNVACRVTNMIWNGIEIEYETTNSEETFFADELQTYKKETMEEIKIDIPKGYEFAGIDDDNQQVIFEKIGCKYPKTYEECCKIMGIEYPVIGGEPDGLSASTYRIDEIRPFIYLLVCRDAYWKIAGEQMGLGNPWEPDWTNDEWPDMAYISYDGKSIDKENGFPCCNIILIFPTEKMRDVFYENFKDLIEQCKELL